MKINRKTIIVLIVIALVLLGILCMGKILIRNKDIYDLIESIIVNILCGCLISIVMCFVNYFIDRDDNENEIVHQLKIYYNQLFNLYMISTTFIENENENEKISLFKTFLNLQEKIENYNYRNKELSYFYDKKRKDFFEEINLFSNGADLWNCVHESITAYEHNAYNLGEVCKYNCEFSENAMKKVDSYMEKLKKYNDIDWKKIKKQERIGFFDENGEVV